MKKIIIFLCLGMIVCLTSGCTAAKVVKGAAGATVSVAKTTAKVIVP